MKVSAAVGAGLAAAACDPVGAPEDTLDAATVTARPVANYSGTAPRGFHRFGLWNANDAYLYVPPTYRDDTPAPFLVLLHGAGGRASNFETLIPAHADDKGIVCLAFNSTLPTWDRLGLGGFGPDIERMNLALNYAFPRVNVDTSRIVLGGFSDGASYALTAGLPNGDLFTGIIGFSAGQLFPPGLRGKPPVFLSHGTSDQVIAITNSRDIIRSQLVTAGYTVTFREFDGGHQIPAAVSEEAFNWVLAL